MAKSHSAPTPSQDTAACSPAIARKRPLRQRGSPKDRLPCYISQLPVELAFLVLSFMSFRGLVAMSGVDRFWRDLTIQQDSVLWYELCQRHRFLRAMPEKAASGDEKLIKAARRWTLTEAQDQRQGFKRALAQSNQQQTSRHIGQYQKTSPDGPVPRTINTWKDFFSTSILLENEWRTGRPVVKELSGHEEAILCVKSLPTWDRVVSGDREGSMRLWCATTGKCFGTHRQHMMGVSCFATHRDLLISGSWDANVIVWRQIRDAPYIKPLKIIDLGEQVMSLYLADNLDLAIGAVSGRVKIISVKTLSSLGSFQSSTRALCTAVSLSSTRIEATIGTKYYAWDRATKAQVGFIGDSHFGNISCMRVDTERRLIVTGSLDSKVRIFSRDSKPMLLRQYGGHREGVRCLALQDNLIITGSSDKTVMITFQGLPVSFVGEKIHSSGSLQRADGSMTLELGEEEEDADPIAEPISLAHSAHVNAVDADASMLVSGSDDGTLRIFHFGRDLWRPLSPTAPRLCGQASLISAASPTCVLMIRSGRAKVSVGSRRQTWGNCALTVFAKARTLQETTEAPPLVWMTVDEIYQRMIEWELQPVSQGSTPKHTLNLALHMMAKSDPPTILIDSSSSPHRFALV